MTIGIVYCAVSQSYPGRCKIGKTFRRAPERIAELQRHYRSRHPFTERASLLVEHYGKVEWLAHRKLAYCREPATEMFRCSPEQAIAVIQWAADEALRNPPRLRPRPEARPTTPAKGRGTCRRLLPWRLVLCFVVLITIAGLRHLQPALPDWLPDQVLRTADIIERW